MKPIPTSFHLGPLEIHTYGVGLDITFWFAYRYFERRLQQRGYETEWVSSLFIWVSVFAVLGARAMHVVSNLSYYADHPSQIIAIWQGGLSSFGGLLAAVPVALVIALRAHAADSAALADKIQAGAAPSLDDETVLRQKHTDAIVALRQAVAADRVAARMVEIEKRAAAVKAAAPAAPAK